MLNAAGLLTQTRMRMDLIVVTPLLFNSRRLP
jgi:hypothetical protein